MRSFYLLSTAAAAALLLPIASWSANNPKFHDAPDSARQMKNPYDGDRGATKGRGTLYARNCLSCHGKTGAGTANIPSLVDGSLNNVSYGEVFWFVTKGSKDNGMPSWAQLPVKQRWQIVTYV